MDIYEQGNKRRSAKAVRKRREEVVVCRDLTVGYKRKAILSRLNLTFESGHFISLLGPNGAGKTTLLRTLSRHLDPLGGSVTLMGEPLGTVNSTDLAKIMAVVLTDKISPPLFTVFEFTALGRYPHTDFLGRLSSEDRRVVNQALAAVHAQELAQRPFSDLSDGERQKALVARALAQQPRLLLLDEPTIHLDLKHRVEVMTILRDLCKSHGITVVASMHDVDVASKVSDRVALIKDGTLADWGAPESVLTGRAVAQLYDFTGASYDRHLGAIELRGDGVSGRAFVVAGMGSGTLVYRMLAKRGFSLSTGVLNSNDIDCYVARSLGAECAVQPAMEAVGSDAIASAVKLMERCDLVVDCGFDVGAMNQGNVTLLRTALEKGKNVLTLRNKSFGTLIEAAPESVSDSNQKVNRHGSVIRCKDVNHLIELLDQQIDADPDHRHCNPDHQYCNAG